MEVCDSPSRLSAERPRVRSSNVSRLLFDLHALGDKLMSAVTVHSGIEVGRSDYKVGSWHNDHILLEAG